MSDDDAFGWKKKKVPEIKEELKRLGLGAHGKKAELVAHLEEHLSTEPSRAEPSRAEPSRAEPSRAEPSRAEPSRAEPSRAEQSRAEPSRA
jgi:hypothetical protein